MKVYPLAKPKTYVIIQIVVEQLTLQGAVCGKTARTVLRGAGIVRYQSTYQALLELMKDKLEEREKAGERNVKIQLIQTKLSKGKTVEAIAEDLEDSVENILSLMKEMDEKKKL